jgi:rubrerythrin
MSTERQEPSSVQGDSLQQGSPTCAPSTMSEKRPEDTKSLLISLLATPGGAALVTVILGGILGTLLNSCIQAGLKDREMEQARQKSRGDLALIEYKDYLERRQEAIKSVFETVGKCAAVSLALISRTELDPKDYRTSQDKWLQENSDAEDKLLAAQKEWRTKQDSLGLQVSYYYENDVDLMNSWNEVKASLTNCITTAIRTYKGYEDDLVPRDVSAVYGPATKDLDEKLAGFAARLERMNKYLWKEFYPTGLSAPTSGLHPG